jgi:uncharacterized heparinase superfamily protein
MMPFHLIDTLKDKASHLAYNNFLYDWSLSEDAPDRMIVRPVDPWKGNADKAGALLMAAGVGDRTGPVWHNEWWIPEDADDIWISHMHGFGWLRDLRTLGGALSREQGRLMIENWIDEYDHWNAQTWRAELIGRRLAMWICHYDYFGANAGEEFEEKFLGSILKQAKHLANVISRSKEIALFESVKGLLYAGIALEGHTKWIAQGLNALKTATSTQILPDGGHVSRSPQMLLEALEIMVDIRSALNAGDYPVPDHLINTIESMSSALRCMRYRDRKFGLFHGTQEGDIEAIDSIIAQAGTHKRPKTSLKSTGYERLELGRSLLLMDTGKAAPSPYDKTAHASPLGFEFCYGKERLLVACGSHPTSSEWKDALRATAAHNTACLDYRNACEIKKDEHFGRKVTQTSVKREETKDAILLVASHNGYVPLNGITHTRKIYLSDNGHDLRGEDDFSSEFDLIQPVETAIRFHIHPGVQASLINEGKEILLRMPGGVGWRFKNAAGALSLEDSVYLGSGVTPRKTKQIVIHGKMTTDNACIKWTMKREG